MSTMSDHFPYHKFGLKFIVLQGWYRSPNPTWKGLAQNTTKVTIRDTIAYNICSNSILFMPASMHVITLPYMPICCFTVKQGLLMPLLTYIEDMVI